MFNLRMLAGREHLGGDTDQLPVAKVELDQEETKSKEPQDWLVFDSLKAS